jgi:hypothetical protein
MRTRARGSFDSALHEPVPQRVLQVARSTSRPASAQVIDLARVRAERKRRNEQRRLLQPQRIAIAASILGGLLIGAVAQRLWSDAHGADAAAVTAYRDGVLVARGALADTLSNQLTDAPAPASRFHVGMSFRAKSGDYCRTFSASDNPSLAGLACHEQQQWRILTLVGSQPATPGLSSTPAAAAHRVAWNLAPLLLQTVRDHISGEPLDQQAEQKARGANWR